MKTRLFPLFALCGVFAGSSLMAQAIDASAPASVTATVPASGAPRFSGRINDVVALAHSGIDPSIVVSYIKTSPGPFEPSADEIIKLRDMGVSPEIITTMMQRGAELRDQPRAVAAAASAPEASAAQAPVVTETPPSTYSESDYGIQSSSTVAYVGGSYGDPYYYNNYPYYTSPYYSGYISTAFFYPFPCWFGGQFFAHGCFFPHGGFVHDSFHVHDGFHDGFHGGTVAHTGNFHGGGFTAGGVRGGFVAHGPNGGVAVGGFHGGNTVIGGGFHGNVPMSGFHGGMGGGSVHMGGGGFSGGGGGMRGGGGGGMHH